MLLKIGIKELQAVLNHIRSSSIKADIYCRIEDGKLFVQVEDTEGKQVEYKLYHDSTRFPRVTKEESIPVGGRVESNEEEEKC